MSGRVESAQAQPLGSRAPTLASRLRLGLRRPFLLRESEAMFEVRGFSATSPGLQRHLERIGTIFIRGYNAALLADDLADPIGVVEHADPALAGFAAEGAATGAAIADAFSFRAHRLESWLRWAGPRFSYLTHVGAGWAFARAPWRRRAIVRLLDPVHCWLAYDGLGFAEAFFDSQRALRGAQGRNAGYAMRAYDQGVGRALWFIFGGDAERAARWISAMPEKRRPDLWSGLGLALAYAGGAAPEAIERLEREAAPTNLPFLAQGAAFAAEAHARAGQIPQHCAEAVRIVARRDVAEVVCIVRQQRSLAESCVDRDRPRYELWRGGVQCLLGESTS